MTFCIFDANKNGFKKKPSREMKVYYLTMTHTMLIVLVECFFMKTKQTKNPNTWIAFLKYTLSHSSDVHIILLSWLARILSVNLLFVECTWLDGWSAIGGRQQDAKKYKTRPATETMEKKPPKWNKVTKKHTCAYNANLLHPRRNTPFMVNRVTATCSH